MFSQRAKDHNRNHSTQSRVSIVKKSRSLEKQYQICLSMHPIQIIRTSFAFCTISFSLLHTHFTLSLSLSLSRSLALSLSHTHLHTHRHFVSLLLSLTFRPLCSLLLLDFKHCFRVSAMHTECNIQLPLGTGTGLGSSSEAQVKINAKLGLSWV